MWTRRSRCEPRSVFVAALRTRSRQPRRHQMLNDTLEWRQANSVDSVLEANVPGARARWPPFAALHRRTSRGSAQSRRTRCCAGSTERASPAEGVSTRDASDRRASPPPHQVLLRLRPSRPPRVHRVLRRHPVAEGAAGGVDGRRGARAHAADGGHPPGAVPSSLAARGAAHPAPGAAPGVGCASLSRAQLCLACRRSTSWTCAASPSARSPEKRWS